jgi:hypothetical protein
MPLPPQIDRRLLAFGVRAAEVDERFVCGADPEARRSKSSTPFDPRFSFPSLTVRIHF